MISLITRQGGASESPFIFENSSGELFCVKLKEVGSSYYFFVLSFLCTLTRPQAFIYIAGISYIVTYYFKTKKL